MKIIIACIMVASACAELPPSNSYLPPTPISRTGASYSQGSVNLPSQSFSPQIVAARNFQGTSGYHAGFSHGQHNSQNHSFGRSNYAALPQSYTVGRHATGRFPTEEPTGYGGRDSASFARKSLEEFNSEPANYKFGYMVNDYQEGAEFGHHEERQEERAQGQYHVVLPDGRKQTVSYQADERGFKPQISYEDSQELIGSGYNSNANNFQTGELAGSFAQNGQFGNVAHENGA